MATKDESSLSKAELAAAARSARRAAQEAEALRANLHRRKQQRRARQDATGKDKPCR